MVFFSYRQGIKDSFYINNNLPLEKTYEKVHDSELAKEFDKMLSYEFEMAGEENNE